MADRKWTGNANRAPDEFAEDDPFAALTRLVEIDASEKPARKEAAATSKETAAAASSPVLDLEAELLKEFERYDASSTGVEVEIAPTPEEVEPEEAPIEPEADAPLLESALDEAEEPSLEDELSLDSVLEEAEAEKVDEPELSFDDTDNDWLETLSLEDDLEAAMAEELDVFNPDEVEEPESDILQETETAAFSGPVPDLDFEEDDVQSLSENTDFSGPVPDLDLESSADEETALDDAEVEFAGPTPDFDFEADFSAAPSGASILDDMSLDEENGETADDMMAGELEMSLGLPEKEDPATSEPVSAFAEWKNERLSVNSTTQETGWVPAPVIGHPGEALGGSTDIAVEEEDEAAEEPDYAFEAEVAEEPQAATVEQAAPVINDPLLELQAIMGKTTPAPTPASAPATEAKIPEASEDIDFDMDSLEMDLASVELEELENIETADDDAAEAAIETMPAEPQLVFDPSQISEVDTDAEFIAELDVPQYEVEVEGEQVAVRDFETDFEADMAELLSENAEVATAAAASQEAAAQAFSSSDLALELQEEIHPSKESGDNYSEDLRDFAEYDAVEPLTRNRRGGLWMALAAGVAVIAIVGGAYAWITFSGARDSVFAGASDEPPIILAESEPFKEIPEDKGGAVVPNQDKAVYDQVEGNSVDTVKQESLIASEEDPVDVVQETTQDVALPLEETGSGEEEDAAVPQDDRLLPADSSETADSGSEKPATIAPRKVKTMIVLPDGSLVPRDDAKEESAADKAVAEAENSASDAVAEAPVAQSVLTPEIRTTDASPQTLPSDETAVQEVANADVEVIAPVRPVKITTITSAPVPVPRPTDQPVNVVSTVSERGNVSSQSQTPTETAAATPVEQPKPQAAAETQQASLPAGTYVVQIASLTSKESAEKTYANLSSRFSSIIGGRGVDIRRADIEGKGTYYRVRIPAGSKDEAISLCQRYKAAGGSCLVSR